MDRRAASAVPGTAERAMLGLSRGAETLPSVVVALVLAATAAGVVATPRLVERAEASSLEQALDAAPVAATRLRVEVTDEVTVRSSGPPLADLDATLTAADDAIPDEIDRVYGPGRVAIDTVRRSITSIDGSPPDNPTTLTFRLHPDLDDHARLVDGRRAAPTDDLVGDLPVVEIELTAGTVEVAGIDLGDELVVEADLDDPLLRRFPGSLPDPFVVRPVGLLELDPPGDPFWAGDVRLHRPVVADTGVGAEFAAFVAYRSDQLPASPLLIDGELPVDVSVRRAVELDAVTLDRADALLDELERFDATTTSISRAGSPAYTTNLDRTLRLEAEQRRTAREATATALVGLAVVAVLTVGAFARVGAARRRGWVAVATARGASTSTVVGSTAVESILRTVAAVGLGAVAAALLVGGATTSTEVALVVALVVATVAGDVALAASERTGPLPDALRGERRVDHTRISLGVDVVIGVVAIGAVVALRRRGADPGGGVDPLIVAVPVLVPLALSVATRRSLPGSLLRLTRGGLRLGVGRLLGLRRAAADLATAGALVATLATTLALASVGLGVAGSLDEAVEAASWRAVGAPARIDTIDVEIADAVLALAPGSAAIRGTALVGVRTPDATDVVRLVNLRTAAHTALTDGTPADLDLPDQLRRPFADGALPVISGRRLSERRVDVGDELEGLGSLNGLRLRVIETRASLDDAEDDTDEDWMLIDRDLLRNATGDGAPVFTILTDEATATDPSVAALAADRGAPIALRGDEVASRRDDPLSRATRVAFLGAAGGAVALSIVATAGVAAVTARRRRQQVATLVLLGARRAETWRAVLAELAPTILAGAATGALGGAVVLATLDERFDLSAYAGGAPVPIRPDAMALLVAGLCLVIGASLTVAVVVRRLVSAATADALRIEGAA